MTRHRSLAITLTLLSGLALAACEEPATPEPVLYTFTSDQNGFIYSLATALAGAAD